MKVKLDENLPERLVPVLTDLGHDTDTVRAERLNGQKFETEKVEDWAGCLWS